jgi:hypothetical protein
MIHRHFKSEKHIAGVLALKFYTLQKFLDLVFGDRFSVSDPARQSILKVFDVDSVRISYGLSILFELCLTTVARLTLSTERLRLDQEQHGETDNRKYREPLNYSTLHFPPPNEVDFYDPVLSSNQICPGLSASPQNPRH